MPLTLAAADARVFFQAGSDVVCLDRGAGKELWRAAVGDQAEAPAGAGRRGKPGRDASRSVGWSVATLVVADGVVLAADGRQLVALAAADGKRLWSCPSSAGFKSPVDVLVVDGLVWLGPEFTEGRDLHSGEVKKTNSVIEQLWTIGHHHRCYREKATDRYLLTGKRGIEFVDLVSDDHSRNNWVRGTCQYGVMPANGLVYAPAHACGCFMEAKLYGFWALAAERDEGPAARDEGREIRLERGPALAETLPASEPSSSPASEWPTFRGDPLRSGSTEGKIALPLDSVWQSDIGGRLSPPVAAEGLVVVSSIDAHHVVALDVSDGKPRWSFTAGGRVDSPPTVYRGLVLFGSADGWVYALRAADGQLAWRFRAAPEDLKTVALDQVESVWPVHGSVLVLDDVAYAAAGRSSYLDGGISVFGLDPATGEVISSTRVQSGHPGAFDPQAAPGAAEIEAQKIDQNAVDAKTFLAADRSDAFAMGGATNDVLVSDGSSVFLRTLQFDRQCALQESKSRHLFSTSGLLDDAEDHRSHWVLGTGDFNRIPVAYSWIANRLSGRGNTHLAVPYGLMLAFSHQTVWGVRRGDRYTLFAEANRPFSAGEESLADFRPIGNRKPPFWQWSVELSMRPRAMLRAGDVLVLAGMPQPQDLNELGLSYEGRRGGQLAVFSAADGSRLAEMRLDSPPVWDGLAAAAGRLYAATGDGKVVCLGNKR